MTLWRVIFLWRCFALPSPRDAALVEAVAIVLSGAGELWAMQPPAYSTSLAM
jgi:hypothetical protein